MDVLALRSPIAAAAAATRQPQAQDAPAPKMEGDRLATAPRTVARLVEANEEAGVLLWRALKRMVRHPLRTLGGFASALLTPLIHPVRSLEETWNTYKRDGKLEGALNGMIWASTLVCTLSLLGMGAALALAPFTGGASLAVMPFLSTTLTIAGWHDVVVCTTLLLKDEYDALTATSVEDLHRQEEQLSDDFLNTAFAWATLKMSDLSSALTVPPQGMIQAARDGLKPGMRRVMKGAVRSSERAASHHVPVKAKAIDPGLRAP